MLRVWKLVQMLEEQLTARGASVSIGGVIKMLAAAEADYTSGMSPLAIAADLERRYLAGEFD